MHSKACNILFVFAIFITSCHKNSTNEEEVDERSKYDIVYREKLANEGFSISDFEVLDINFNAFCFTDILSEFEEQTIFVRFNWNHCSSCIDDVLVKVCDFMERKSDYRVVIINSFLNRDDMLRFKFFHDRADKLTLYHVSPDDFYTPAEDSNIPYIFQLDSLTLSNFLLIDTHRIALLDDHLANLE